MSGQGHGGGQSGGHSGQHSGGESGHHSAHIGNLSNDNMLGGDYQYWNLANLMEGLKINSGIRFAILFMAFTGWLYVIYWIRHHEPCLNQIMGTHYSLAPTAAQDKSMIAAIKTVFPWKTSPEMGSIYSPSIEASEKFKDFSTPTTNENEYTQPPPQFENTAQTIISVPAGQATAAPIEYAKPNFDERFGLPANSQTNYVPSNSPILEPSMQNYPSQNYQSKLNSNLADPNSIYTSYQSQLKSGQSNVLKTVISR